VVNAVEDAIRPFGVRDVTMPCSPEHVWRALEEARGSGATNGSSDVEPRGSTVGHAGTASEIVEGEGGAA
jgi:hypothetical protein